MTKGKNFSCNNQGKRKESDFYETPYSITQQFLDAEKINHKEIFEPSCGNFAITKVLENNGYKVVSKDLKFGDNFLLQDKKDYTECIVTNPPFSLANNFIKKAKEISNYFAFLLPLSYLHGKKRYDEIYSDKSFPLARVYIFTRYPMLGDELREDGRYRTGMMVYAWYVFDKNYSGEPIIRWIDNHSYVLGSR